MEQTQENPGSVVILHGTGRLVRLGWFGLDESGLVLKRIAIGLTPQGAADAEGVIVSRELLSPVVRELIRSKGIESRRAGMALGGRGLAVGLVRVPNSPPAELASRVEQETARAAPWPPEEYVSSFIPMAGSPGAESVSVVFAAARSLPLQTALAALANSRLDVQLADAAPIAALRASADDAEGPRYGVWFGDSLTVCAMIAYGEITALKTLDFGFDHIVSDLAEAVNKDEKTVFNLLLKRRIDMNAPQEGEGSDPIVNRVRTRLTPMVDQLGAALRELAGADEQPPRIILSGEIGRFRNLDDFLSRRLGIETESARPLDRVETESTGLSRAALEGIGPELAPMIGAARSMLGLEPPWGLNLLEAQEPAPEAPIPEASAAVEPLVEPAAGPELPAPGVRPYDDDEPGYPPVEVPVRGRRTPIPLVILCLLIIVLPLTSGLVLFKLAVSRAAEAEEVRRSMAAEAARLSRERPGEDAQAAVGFLEPRLQLYFGVVGKRPAWSLVLEEITRSLGPDTVLTRIQLIEADLLSVRGRAETQAAPDALAGRFEASEWFRAAEVINIVRERGRRDYVFELRMVLEDWPVISPHE